MEVLFVIAGMWLGGGFHGDSDGCGTVVAHDINSTGTGRGQGLYVATRGSLYDFFFQAEDGIRDDLVTGVQTCALPISSGTQLALQSAPAAQANGASCPVAGSSEK